MRKIFLLIAVIMILAACNKEDKMTYQELIQLLEIEKAKVNQDSLSALLEGEWFGIQKNMHTHVLFSSNPKNFKAVSHLETTDCEDYDFNVDDYFLLKIDSYHNLYNIVSYHDRYNLGIPDCYGIVEITKEYISYSEVSASTQLREQMIDNPGLIYEYIMAKFDTPYIEGGHLKLHKINKGT